MQSWLGCAVEKRPSFLVRLGIQYLMLCRSPLVGVVKAILKVIVVIGGYIGCDWGILSKVR